jgi:hypothetical protein
VRLGNTARNPGFSKGWILLLDPGTKVAGTLQSKTLAGWAQLDCFMVISHPSNAQAKEVSDLQERMSE